MTQRELDLKIIIKEFSIWEVNLANHNSLNFQDGNLISEYTICEVLNCIFGYELSNANALKNNHAAIDLKDDINRICFQVTSISSVTKINDTLEKFAFNSLQNNFDILYVLILGKKQKSYRSLKVPSEISFDPAGNIIDFRDLIKLINFLPAAKLTRLKSILTSTSLKEEKPSLSKVAELQKKTLAMKKRFCKDFIDTTPKRDWQPSDYSPRINFNYGSVILRDVNDRTFPGGDPEAPKWTKCEFSDMYEYGVEFVRQAGYVIVDPKGNWDLLDITDTRSNNPLYKKVSAWVFYRLAFENIITYDLESDGYYGYPTIFCHFRHDGFPFEEILFGELGLATDLHVAYYFEDSKRTKLP